jgi:hypothetical protein
MLCDGNLPGHPKNGNPKNSKAFCEGMEYRAKDFGDAAPITDNPHQTGSDAFKAWDAGWAIAQNAQGDVIAPALVGCCGLIGVTIPTDVEPI